MKDYSKISDFEINKAVGESTGEALNTEETLNLVIRNSTGRRFDPCNSWADAGPLLVESKIGIVPSQYDGRWLASGGYGKPSVTDENPLRAAMIVYLMMHDKGEE